MQGNYKQAFEAYVYECEHWYELQPKISLATLTYTEYRYVAVYFPNGKEQDWANFSKKMPKSTQKFLMKGHKKDEQRPASKLLKLGTGD